MIPKLILLRPYKSVLCLNGRLPERLFFESLALPVIAADGAANTLYEIGIKPYCIVGDLDSVWPHLLEGNKFIHSPEQNSNDFQKCLRYLESQQLLPSIVVGINGGYLDHILNNINIFINSDCLLYAPPIQGFVLKIHEKKNLKLPLNTKLSLLGIPNAVVSTKGLKWELDTTTLTFPGFNSCYNRTVAPTIELNNHEGQVLVLVYTDSWELN